MGFATVFGATFFGSGLGVEVGFCAAFFEGGLGVTFFGAALGETFLGGLGFLFAGLGGVKDTSKSN